MSNNLALDGTAAFFIYKEDSYVKKTWWVKPYRTTNMLILLYSTALKLLFIKNYVSALYIYLHLISY